MIEGLSKRILTVLVTFITGTIALGIGVCLLMAIEARHPPRRR
jgi:capsule polysaccharide export protein KpsE/RkpR